MLIIPCHIYLSTRNLIVLFQVIVCIAMHFVLVEMFRNSVLLIDNPSKRGDVETATRSSVFLSSQVKMEFKLTASR